MKWEFSPIYRVGAFESPPILGLFSLSSLNSESFCALELNEKKIWFLPSPGGEPQLSG